MNGIGQITSTIHRMRTSVASTPKYRAKPAHTPAIFWSSAGRESFSVRGGGAVADPVCDAPHWLQNLALSSRLMPHLVQNMEPASKF
jgi:hypothetical protein